MVIKFGLFLSMTFITFCFGAAAQAITGRNVDDHLLIKDAEKTLGLDDESEIEGTPYLAENFAPGEVHFKKGNPTSAALRYNIFNDYMEFQQNGKTYILDPTPQINKVVVNDYIFVVGTYESKGKLRQGYFTLLDSGKIMLLTKQIVTFHERKEVKALETSATPAKYKRAADAYYYKVGNGALIKIENLKKMIENLPDRQTEVSQFAKQEKISVRKEDELKKLFRYYNSL